MPNPDLIIGKINSKFVILVPNMTWVVLIARAAPIATSFRMVGLQTLVKPHKDGLVGVNLEFTIKLEGGWIGLGATGFSPSYA